jgi:hypothetical protein
MTRDDSDSKTNFFSFFDDNKRVILRSIATRH